jgi:hypothetical protein
MDRQILRRALGIPIDPAHIGIWRNVLIGGMIKKAVLVRFMSRYIPDAAAEVVRHRNFHFSRKPRIVSLGRVLIRDLGFANNPLGSEVLARIMQFGDLCSPETAPSVRLAFSEERFEGLYFAMKSLPDAGGTPRTFALGEGGGCNWFDAVVARPDSRYFVDSHIVFVLRDQPHH